MRKGFFVTALIFLCIFVLAACADREKNVNPVTRDKGVIIKEASMFGSLKLRVIKRYPYVVIAADISGNLPDSCTSIKEIRQILHGNTIFIKVMTQRPENMMCAQALVAFKKTIKIDTAKLKKGKYKVVAGRLKAEFTTGIASD